MLMFRLLLGLIWLMPVCSSAQPLGNRLILLGGIQHHIFYSAPNHEASALLQDQTGFRSQIEVNYAFWRQGNNEVFGGIRLTQGILERYSKREYYGGLGLDDDRAYSVFHTFGAQIGYRYWLPENTRSKYGIETSLILIHQRLSGFVPTWINYSYEVVPFGPALRIGTIWNLDWLVCSYTVIWQPFPVFYRTFDATLDGNPINSGQRDGPLLGYKSLQLGITFGLRL